MKLTTRDRVSGIAGPIPDYSTEGETDTPQRAYWRQQQRDYRAGWRRREVNMHDRTRPQPVCGVCGYRVVGCIGKFGDWKHVFNNREIADDGHRAMPECEP